MELKELVGLKAAEYIKDGMTVGLGTGSTAYYFVKEIGRRVNEEGLAITGVTTSIQTKELAESSGIPLKSVDEVTHIDITVDGADEISEDFQGIKGGGGALLFEKIVADNSKEVIWIVDESKMVKHLGAFPLPVEVVRYGSIQLFNKFTEKGYNPEFRKTATGENYLTDEKNNIIDLHLGEILDPRALAEDLIHLTGVVEHGLFLDCVDTVLVGTKDGVKVIEANR